MRLVAFLKDDFDESIFDCDESYVLNSGVGQYVEWSKFQTPTNEVAYLYDTFGNDF